jgi:glycosyltransferase involved in cell wall biosynthesis
MKVIFDARVTAYQYTGLGRFAGDLLIALLERRNLSNIDYIVLIYRQSPDEAKNSYHERISQHERMGACRIVECSVPPISLRHHIGFNKLIDGLGADVYFYPHFDLPIRTKTSSIVMVHDLFPTKVPGYIVKHSLLKITYFKIMLAYIARKAKFVFALSNATKVDYLQEVGAKFEKNVGVSLAGTSLSKDNTQKTINQTYFTNYILYVGDRRPHKNLPRILNLFRLLKESGRYSGELVLVGNKKNHDVDIDNLIQGMQGVSVLGQIDDGRLTSLYRNCDALIFLSKYEGLGLPILEAAAYKKRIIVSDGGALPEFSPPWALTVPNSAQIENELERVADYLKFPIESNLEFGTKFSWEETAERIENGFKRVDNEGMQNERL